MGGGMAAVMGDPPEGFMQGMSENEIWYFLLKAAAAGCVIVFVWMYYAIKFFTWMSAEPVIKYAIDVPVPAGGGKILERPSTKAEGSSAIQCYAPATGELLGLVNPASPEAIDRAIEKATAAQDKWARTTFTQRRQVLRCIQWFIQENQDDICRIACLDSGKTMVDAMLGETMMAMEKIRWTYLHGEKALKPSRRPTNLLMSYKRNVVHYEPMGVVAALVSWNYPFHNIVAPAVSAIFAGNGIVVKASEQTAWSSAYFTSIVKGALHVCGHDPKLVQMVVTWPQTANHLTSHPGISHVTFIGSRPVMKHVAAAAAKSLTPCLAELGGKDAAIVLDSAVDDLPRIIETLLRGTFQSSGQNCIGIERIIACPRVYDKIVLALEPRIKAIRVGSILDDPNIDMGAMISDANFERLEKLVEAAVADGARCLVGGKRYQHPVHRYGHYFQPTLLVDVKPEMAIANEECFGPICTVLRAKNAEDACNISNYPPDFGLGGAVFGANDVERESVVRGLKTGMVAVNDFAVFYAVQLPFGGVGGSGYGRFAGEEGLRGLSNLKSICEDRWGWAGICTAIPKQVRYPIPDPKKGYEFVKSVVEIGYGVRLWDTVIGLKRMWKNA